MKFEDELNILNIAIQTMDIPAERRYLGDDANLKWLQRNLGIKNSGHRHFSQAMTVLKTILASTNAQLPEK